MTTKKCVTAMAMFAAVLLVFGEGTSQSSSGSGTLFPRLAQLLQGAGSGTRPPMPPPPHGSPILRCIGRIDSISSDVQSSIDALVQAREEAKDRDARKALRDAYSAALTASPLDEDALASAQEALITDMQADMQANFDLEKSIVALLSADQLTELSACIENSGPPAAK